ncbi:hypothetical protein EJ110_NYTH17131 [Nymphaea thermarum]|nr:hypothetical protein EJ110_NYTH17131 [Nymphaea thermarum]
MDNSQVKDAFMVIDASIAEIKWKLRPSSKNRLIAYLFTKVHVADAISNLSSKPLHIYMILVCRNVVSKKDNFQELMRSAAVASIDHLRPPLPDSGEVHPQRSSYPSSPQQIARGTARSVALPPFQGLRFREFSEFGLQTNSWSSAPQQVASNTARAAALPPSPMLAFPENIVELVSLTQASASCRRQISSATALAAASSGFRWPCTLDCCHSYQPSCKVHR